MSLPNFICAGVAKAATTSIYDYAAQHPDIYMTPVKETNYFALYGDLPRFRGPGDRTIINRIAVSRESDYLALFTGRSEPVLGEASPRYMRDPRVPGRIAADVPQVRLVIGLRNPVDRAFAQWTWARMSGRERLPFEKAIELGEEREQHNWAWGNYLGWSYYADQLDRFYRRFDREQIHVYLFEDFVADPGGQMRQIYAFLGVDPAFEPNTIHIHNRSGILPGRWTRAAWEASTPLRNAIRPAIPRGLRHRAFLAATRNAEKPTLDPRTRIELTDLFRSDVVRTQELIERDLTHWLEEPTPK